MDGEMTGSQRTLVAAAIVNYLFRNHAAFAGVLSVATVVFVIAMPWFLGIELRHGNRESSGRPA